MQKHSAKRYFDEDDEAAAPDLAYIPAPNSPSANRPSQVLQYFEYELFQIRNLMEM